MAFLLSFVVIALVMASMAIGVMAGRGTIKGSCGGVNSGECACVKKCLKKRMSVST